MKAFKWSSLAIAIFWVFAGIWGIFSARGQYLPLALAFLAGALALFYSFSVTHKIIQREKARETKKAEEVIFDQHLALYKPIIPKNKGTETSSSN